MSDLSLTHYDNLSRRTFQLRDLLYEKCLFVCTSFKSSSSVYYYNTFKLLLLFEAIYVPIDGNSVKFRDDQFFCSLTLS